MDIIKALILGLVQGLTEFLPVSSSGHLVLMQHYLNFPLPPLMFDIMLHFGTLLAVVYVFKKDILVISKSALEYFKHKSITNNNVWFLLMIIVGTIPTGLIGIFFKPYFESLFTSVLSVSFALIGTAFILMLAELLGRKAKNERISIVNAILIGIMQGVAIIPGISRSGATISMGIMQGINREVAAKYSFLLSIPAVLGAIVLEFNSVNLNILTNNWQIYLLGTLMAIISGILAIKTLLWVLRKYNLYIFSAYCVILGSLVIWRNM
ncbi:MAG: undecaprenyl-diphosphatase UppP [bacterium]|nr:undecaprenyl-diphosphatase UppP [bacterium]